MLHYTLVQLLLCTYGKVTPLPKFPKGRSTAVILYNGKLAYINLNVGSPTPAFTGVRNFPTCIFYINFRGLEFLKSMLQAEGSMQGDCLPGGC